MIRTVFLAGGLALVVALVAVTYSPVLAVDRVTVGGVRRTEPAQVLRAAGLDSGDLMLALDEADLRREVAELPWVRRVSVARSWPGTVRLQITERTPVAFVARSRGRFALVDESARVLEVGKGKAPGLARLAGAGPGRPGETLAGQTEPLAVAAALEGPVGLYIGAIHRRPDGLELELRTGGWVRFGPATEVPEKLVALNAVLPTVSDRCPTVDVRVPRAPVLTQERRCA